MLKCRGHHEFWFDLLLVIQLARFKKQQGIRPDVWNLREARALAAGGFPNPEMNDEAASNFPHGDQCGHRLARPRVGVGGYCRKGRVAGLPTVSFIVPNLNDDMTTDLGLPEAQTISQGDQWLSANLGPYITWAMSNNSLFIFTFDEDDGSGNRVATIAVGAGVAARGKSSVTKSRASPIKLTDEMIAARMELSVSPLAWVT